MKYISILTENGEYREYWMELDVELYALRQVIIGSDARVHVSCRGDYLAEDTVIAEEEDGECREVTPEEFEEVWASAVKRYRGEWSAMKAKYPIGCEVQGICQYFYPQGMIVEGKDFAAVYQGAEDVRCGENLTAHVAGYDEANMWLVLGRV